MKILVVDDEQDLCEILAYNLQNEGYEVTTANSAEQALTLNLSEYSLFMLDVMMGEMSGFDLARRLRLDDKTARIPIIFITALEGDDNMVKGLNIGADDYIAKPLSMKVVKARVKAVLRRANPEGESADEPTTITYGTLALNTGNKTLTIDGQQVSITKIEFELLLLLLKNPEKVFSREELLERCWPHDTVVLDRTVDVNITRLRKKIGEYGAHIKTRFGYGYFFEK